MELLCDWSRAPNPGQMCPGLGRAGRCPLWVGHLSRHPCRARPNTRCLPISFLAPAACVPLFLHALLHGGRWPHALLHPPAALHAVAHVTMNVAAPNEYFIRCGNNHRAPPARRLYPESEAFMLSSKFLVRRASHDRRSRQIKTESAIC